MKGPLANLMKQAQRMQEDMQRAQEEIARMECTGRHDVKSVKIAPELLSEDVSMLEDLLAAAVNDANRKVEKQSSEKMSGLTNGLNLPPGMKLPF